MMPSLLIMSNHIQPALNPHLTRVMAANQAFSFVPMTASSLLQEPIQTSNQLMNNYAMQFHSSNPSSMTINPPYTSNTPAAAAALRPSSQRSHTEVNTSGVLSMMNADSSRSQSMAPLPQGMVSSASHMQLQLPDDHQLNDQQSLEPLPQRPESPVTTTQRNLEELELEDVNGVVLKCPQCDKEFSKPYSLKSHMVVHSGVKPHACDECGHSFARRHDLLRHYRTLHNSSRPFKCQHCSMSFVKEDILQRHMESRHVVKQYVASSHAPSTEATDPSSPDSNRPDGHALIHAGGPGRLASDDTVGTKKRKTSVARRRSRNMQAPLVHSIDSGNTCEQVIEAIEVSASPSSSNLNIECGVVYNSTLLPQLPAGSMLKAEGGYSASSQANASQVSAELQSLQAHQHRVIQQMQYQKQQQQFQIPMSGSLPPYPVASPQHQQFQQMQHIQQQLRQQQMQQHTYPMQFQLTNGLSAHSLADGQAHPHHNLPLNSHQQAQNLYQQPRPHSQSMQLPIQSHSQPFDFSPNSLTPNTFTGMNPTPSSIAPLASSHIHASRIDPTPSPVSLDITGIYDDFSMWQ
ncbi:Zinc finger and BTB domain-containing protein 44, variant 2 [Batrachochytrium dendrobatidis]